jgi:hypothetical protein
MLLAPGVTWNGGLVAEEFHVLPTHGQRQVFVCRSQSRTCFVSSSTIVTLFL